MKAKIKKIMILGIISIISMTFLRCQNDEDLIDAEATNLKSVKKWFNDYESTDVTYEPFKNLDYDWEHAKAKKIKKA